MRTIALEIDGAQKRPKESQLRYPRNSCSGKNPVSRISNENPVILFFGGGGVGGGHRDPTLSCLDINNRVKTVRRRKQHRVVN